MIKIESSFFKLTFMLFLLIWIASFKVYSQGMQYVMTYHIDPLQIQGISSFAPSDRFPQKIIDTAQIKCTYLLIYSKNKQKIAKKSEDKMILRIGKRYSKFSSYFVDEADSISRVELLNKTYRTARPENGDAAVYTQVIKNYRTNNMMVIEKLNMPYVYDEPMNTFVWNLLSDTATILGYKCQKATTFFRGRHFEAWFTNEIPLTEGPWKFNGLPGLILKVEDYGKEYLFECIGLETNDQSNINIPKNIDKYTNITRKQFAKTEKNFYQDPIIAIKSMAIKNWNFEIYDASSTVMTELTAGQVFIRYNPIELE